jgi:hypothetical protein
MILLNTSQVQRVELTERRALQVTIYVKLFKRYEPRAAKVRLD